MGVYVQYGCGASCPDGWINFDASPTLLLQKIPAFGRAFKRGPIVFDSRVRFGDIVRGLPVPDGYADGVYASHVLEHLALDDFWIALKNTRRILKPGGVFRLIVPDLEGRARKYLKRISEGAPDANSRFMLSAHLGARSRSRSIAGRFRSAFGNSAHLWMWDEPSITAALVSVGFTDVRRAHLGDSPDTAFSAVESPTRFVDQEDFGEEECAMEARRPFTD